MLIYFWNSTAPLVLGAGTGSFALNGQAVQFELLHLEAGSFALTGQSVNFVVPPDPLHAAYGSFTLTGQPVSFRLGSSMLLRNAAAYSILVNSPTAYSNLTETPPQLDG